MVFLSNLYALSSSKAQTANKNTNVAHTTKVSNIIAAIVFLMVISCPLSDTSLQVTGTSSSRIFLIIHITMITRFKITVITKNIGMSSPAIIIIENTTNPTCIKLLTNTDDPRLNLSLILFIQENKLPISKATMTIKGNPTIKNMDAKYSFSNAITNLR